MTENTCKCASDSTGMYGVGVASTGAWNPAGWYTPSYTYSSGYYAPKCINCGYCACCGKADIPGNVTGEAKPDFIGK